MCLGDQQFVTLLLYLGNMCVFVVSIDEMLEHIKLVFKRMKEFNSNLKPKKCNSFQCGKVFLGYVLSANSISANACKADEVKNWSVQTNQKTHTYFWVWYHITTKLFQNSLLLKKKCVLELAHLTSSKKNQK